MTEILTETQDDDRPLYEQLRNALIYGNYEPGQKLKIDALKRDFSAGQNAIREALVRLSVEGLVIAEDQKGFRVAPAGLDELRDLAYMRNLLEAEGVSRSIEHGDLEWEGRVAAALRKLNRTEEALLQDQASVETWTRYDLEFHLALMSACDSKLMLRTYEDLFVKYRQFVFRELQSNGFRGREIIAEHLAIGEAALARDTGRCLALLREHANTYLNRQLRQERH